ncbi:MAG: hypothetical protein QOF30_636 [Acidimicrobiaceae bacterium]|nr:hypothetical protein [Acidimicrobiaceae bacterium]
MVVVPLDTPVALHGAAVGFVLSHPSADMAQLDVRNGGPDAAVGPETSRAHRQRRFGVAYRVNAAWK